MLIEGIAWETILVDFLAFFLACEILHKRCSSWFILSRHWRERRKRPREQSANCSRSESICEIDLWWLSLFLLRQFRVKDIFMWRLKLYIYNMFRVKQTSMYNMKQSSMGRWEILATCEINSVHFHTFYWVTWMPILKW